MKVSITQADIDSGRPDHTCLCPIALAIDRALRARGIDIRGVQVDASRVDIAYVADGLRWRTIDLPESATQFIEGFDFGTGVEPFEFELQLT